MFIAIPCLFLQGKWTTIISISLLCYNVFFAIEYVNRGLLYAQMGRNSLEIDEEYRLTIFLAVILIFVAAYAFLKRGNRASVKIDERITPLIISLSLLSMMMIAYDPWYFGNLDQKDSIVIQGRGLIQSGLFLIMGVVILVFIWTLDHKQRDLQRLNEWNQSCMREQAEQYLVMQEKDYLLRKFRHDYQDHLDVLYCLTASNENARLLEYIEQLRKKVSKTEYIRTGNLITDAIINRYKAQCDEEKIRFVVIGKLEQLTMDETDLCILLANGIRNAYEAARDCIEEKSIEVIFRCNEPFLFIVITNSCAMPPARKDGKLLTSKSDTESHGLGTQNMIETVEKYNGDIRWNYDESHKLMRTEITLCIN